MSKVLIVQNSHEGPGLLTEVLKENGLDHDLIILDRGDKIPSPLEYAAMVVLGGPDSANDSTEKMLHELERIREAIEAKIPYLGICLGLQTLVKAAGGSVTKNPTREIGFRDPDGNLFAVEIVEQDALLKDLPTPMPVFQLHGETVELTDEMLLLARGKFCTNQIVRTAPKQYGIQCHFELTNAMFEDWLATDPDLVKQDAAQNRRDFQSISEAYRKTGKKLFQNFIDIAIN
jgi:GMP synthase-like glutamine amidotransferase